MPAPSALPVQFEVRGYAQEVNASGPTAAEERLKLFGRQRQRPQRAALGPGVGTQTV